MAFSSDLIKAGRIADKIGMPATMMLAGWFGGRNVYVPTTTDDPEHLLRKIAGNDAFVEMVANWPGEYLAIPECDVTPLRRAGIVHRLTARGISAADIGQITGLCSRSVRLIRDQLRLEGFAEIADLLPQESEANHAQ